MSANTFSIELNHLHNVVDKHGVTTGYVYGDSANPDISGTLTVTVHAFPHGAPAPIKVTVAPVVL